MERKTVSLVRGAILRNFNLILRVAITFFLMPFIIRSLGKAMFGLWVLVGTLMDYYGFLDLGLSRALERYISRYMGNKDENKINTLISTTFFAYLGISVIILIVSLGIMLLSPRFIKDPNSVYTFRAVILILAINMAIMFPMKVYRGILHASLKYEISVLSECGAMVVRSLMVLFFLSRGHGIITLTFITFITNILKFFVLARYSVKIFPAPIHLKINTLP